MSTSRLLPEKQKPQDSCHIEVSWKRVVPYFIPVKRRRSMTTFELGVPEFRSDRPGIRKVIGDLEAEIMELIWARPPEQGTTVRDVFEMLYKRRKIAYTTVMSTMSRLAKKHLLRIEKQEQTYVYTPTMTEQE